MTALESVVVWPAQRLDEIVDLFHAALPDEHLSADDLEGVTTAEAVQSTVAATDPSPAIDSLPAIGPSVVLATADGSGAVVVGTRCWGELVRAYIQLLGVHPMHRRRGIARSLVTAAQDWASRRGATVMQVGGAAPFYLYSGVDTRWTHALCCFESLGYERTSVALDLRCPTMAPHRHGVPSGVVVRGVDNDRDHLRLLEFAERRFPHWLAEFDRAAAAGTVMLADAAGAVGESMQSESTGSANDGEGSIVGAAAHSVSRSGVIGPVAVAPNARRSGVGSALMSAVLSELSVAGLHYGEIGWVSSIGFYAETCGAQVYRTSQVYERSLLDDARSARSARADA